MPQDSTDALEEEVLDYKSFPPICSSEINGEASSSGGLELCSYCEEIRTLHERPRFLTLRTFLAKCVLSLPVSNTDTERVSVL